MEEIAIDSAFELDPSIARGLDYYTGVVFESFLDGCPEIGSVCSGGRYDNLAGLYTKERLPGVGASVGLDRLIAALATLGRFSASPSYAQVAIICIKPEHAGKYQAAAETLRAAGISCDVFLEPDKPVRQYQAAEKKGIPYALIPEDGGLWTLRCLATRTDEKGLGLEEAEKKLSADNS
jgi:histidyl-tRNA synthetase